MIFKIGLLLLLINLGNTNSLAQVSNTLPWTWMKGDNTSNNAGVYGTMGIANPANKPGSREGTGMNWTDASGNLWMFGGQGYAAAGSGALSDLWKYDALTNNWTWVNGNNTTNNTGVYGTKGVPSSTNKPGGRALSTTWSDNSGNLWLFGGAGFSSACGNGLLNDLWKYNIAANQWTWMSGDDACCCNYGVYGTKGVAATTNKPGGRARASRPDSKADVFGNLWLFGGNGLASVVGGDLNDLWKYDTGTNLWTWMSGDDASNVAGIYGTMGVPAAANKPASRVGGVCWIDTTNKLWLSGGSGSNSNWSPKYSDLWKFDPVTSLWTWVKGNNTSDNYGVYGTQGIPAAANNPGGRLMAEGWIDNIGNAWVFGGYGFSATGTGNSTGTQGLNDLWKYDPLTNNWTWMKGDNIPNIPSVYGTQGVTSPTNKLGERSGGNQWKDNKGNLWQFGGIEWDIPTVWKNDLWKLVIPQPVAKGNLVSCQILPTVIIDATNNNTWVPVFDNIGNIAAEINANLNNLGLVNTSLYTKTGPCREDGSNRLYLNRNITITPQTQPGSNVSVRLYILKAELDSLRMAVNSMNQPSGVLTINEVDVFKNYDNCITVGGNTALRLTATSASYNSDYYLQVSISSFSSFYFANKLLSAILPVKLKSFTGKRSGAANELKWEASCFEKVVFNIERSADGIHFNSIGNITANYTDCNRPFFFTDKDPLPEINYYRLRIVEINGATSYSPIIVVSSIKSGPVQISLRNNPASNLNMDIELSSESNEQVELLIADVTGRVMLRNQLYIISGINHQFIKTGELANGLYWIYGVGKWGRTNVVKFVK